MQKINPAITGYGHVFPDSQPGYHYATGPPNKLDLKWVKKVYQQTIKEGKK